MDVDDWQANRIRNSRYTQDGNVRPWPSGIQVQILGAGGCGRHSLLKRLCLGKYGENYNIASDCNSSSSRSRCRQTYIRGQSCTISFSTPPSLTSCGNGYPLSNSEYFDCITRGIRDCDALILAYDISSPRSFQVLCEFCARCELDSVDIAPGTSIPCLVVGLKGDLPNRVHVDDGWSLARRLGGSFIMCSAKTGRGLSGIMDEAVGPVVEARARLVQESEETLGEAIRHLMTFLSDRRTTLRRKLHLRRKVQQIEGPRPVTPPACTGAPPRWTMRTLVTPPSWAGSGTILESEDSDGTLVDPCPLQYQLPMDLIEPADIDWGPAFEEITGSRKPNRNR